MGVYMKLLIFVVESKPERLLTQKGSTVRIAWHAGKHDYNTVHLIKSEVQVIITLVALSFNDY